MTEICIDMGYGIKYRRMATSQDEIGWRRFMEGMIFKEARQLQEEYRSLVDHGQRGYDGRKD